MEKKYILIEVVEREISAPEFYDTYNDAYSAMMGKFKASLALDDEDLASAEPVKDADGCFQLDEDCCYGKWNAFGERYGQNFDWRIFEP